MRSKDFFLEYRFTLGTTSIRVHVTSGALQPPFLVISDRQDWGISRQYFSVVVLRALEHTHYARCTYSSRCSLVETKVHVHV